MPLHQVYCTRRTLKKPLGTRCLVLRVPGNWYKVVSASYIELASSHTCICTSRYIPQLPFTMLFNNSSASYTRVLLYDVPDKACFWVQWLATMSVCMVPGTRYTTAQKQYRAVPAFLVSFCFTLVFFFPFRTPSLLYRTFSPFLPTQYQVYIYLWYVVRSEAGGSPSKRLFSPSRRREEKGTGRHL